MSAQPEHDLAVIDRARRLTSCATEDLGLVRALGTAELGAEAEAQLALAVEHLAAAQLALAAGRSDAVTRYLAGARR